MLVVEVVESGLRGRDFTCGVTAPGAFVVVVEFTVGE